jgi:hypothetical protein
MTEEVIGAAVILVVVIAGVTVALVGNPSRQAATVARTASVTRSAQPAAPPQPVHAAAPIREAGASAHVPKAIAPAPRQTPVVTVKKPLPDPVPPAPVAMTATAVAPAPAPAPKPVATEQSTAAPAIEERSGAANHAITISGCLEMTVDENQFRLTDTDGAGAPKARSWRSGFLKKGSAPVELVEISDAPALRSYVGHRVTATGLLTGRQLRVRSVQTAGSSCE